MPQSNSAQSPSVQTEQEIANKENQLTLTPELKNQLSLILKRALQSRSDREQPHHDFDGMTYTRDYDTNQDAAVTFLQPKQNDDDVRINTATTEKKLEVLINEMMSLNIQAEILAFDLDDREHVNLGKDFEHLVIKTNQIEREEDMMLDSIRELLTQRAVFIEEVTVIRQVKNSMAEHGVRRDG